MNITQTFYDNMAADYDKLFQDWQAATREQAEILDKIFRDQGVDPQIKILDCACGIGTQSIGLAALGYLLTSSDISDAELEEAAQRAKENKVNIRFAHADFTALEEVFSELFDVVIAMDNPLAHMLTREDMEKAIGSITGRIKSGGLFVSSFRDYDGLLEEKPAYSPPYIHNAQAGKRVSFQTWDWEGDIYHLTQYIIDDQDALSVGKFLCSLRAVRRQEVTDLLLAHGCQEVVWKFPEETGFYQPIVIAKK